MDRYEQRLTDGRPGCSGRGLPPLLLGAALAVLASPLTAATGKPADPAAAPPAMTGSSIPRMVPQAKPETAGKPLSAKDWRPPAMPEPAPFSKVDIDPEQAKVLAERWGVKLLDMRLTSAGFMLDFRFRVLDADKALPLFDHRFKPYIVAQRSKIKLPVPMAAKVGALRPTNRGRNIKPDKNYYMIFGNPDRHVKLGEKVTVVIGDFKAENLVVN